MDFHIEVADLLTKMTTASKAVYEEKVKFREVVNMLLEDNSRVRSLEDVHRTHKSLIQEPQARVRRLNVCIDCLDKDLEVLRRSEAEDREALKTFYGVRSEYVAASVLLEEGWGWCDVIFAPNRGRLTLLGR